MAAELEDWKRRALKAEAEVKRMNEASKAKMPETASGVTAYNPMPAKTVTIRDIYVYHGTRSWSGGKSGVVEVLVSRSENKMVTMDNDGNLTTWNAQWMDVGDTKYMKYMKFWRPAKSFRQLHSSDALID